MSQHQKLGQNDPRLQEARAPMFDGSMGYAIKDRNFVNFLCTSVSAVQAYLCAGYSPNELDTDGRPLLSVSASFGHADVVAAWLDGGASPHLLDIDGLSPLHHATTPACAELLLLHGADPNLPRYTDC